MLNYIGIGAWGLDRCTSGVRTLLIAVLSGLDIITDRGVHDVDRSRDNPNCRPSFHGEVMTTVSNDDRER